MAPLSQRWLLAIASVYASSPAPIALPPMTSAARPTCRRRHLGETNGMRSYLFKVQTMKPYSNGYLQSKFT